MRSLSRWQNFHLLADGELAVDQGAGDYRAKTFHRKHPVYGKPRLADVSPGQGGIRQFVNGGEPRGTWLLSKQEYGDFVLRFDFKLGPTGNSGCALRAPLFGDPAFDGMELQMADYRYNPQAKDSELAGGIYRAIAPLKQVYKPTEWNSYVVTLNGPKLHVTLNGTVIHDLNLDQQDQVVLRHNGQTCPKVKDRPRKGHIGFQELSRGAEHVQIRNARIKVLDKPQDAQPKPADKKPESK